ncbi:MAG: hypothetical protein K2N30_03620 [Clostridia bacterium]|nr:hypothetical protein [Clostridia bacterium]
MRKPNKALKLLLCASLICSIGVSATACNVNDPATNPEDPEPNGPVFVPPAQDASEGIDWTKYWDGVSNVAGSTADNFKFEQTKDIGNVSGDYVPDGGSATNGEQCTVKFSDGVATQSVTSGGTAVKPVTPQLDGKMFVNWHVSNSNEAYDFSQPVTTNLNLVAEWADLDAKIISANGFNESLAVVWEDNTPSAASVKYRKVNGTWANVDKPLIRNVDGNARVDIVGLPAGDYEVEITTSSNAKLSLPKPITVEAYDRSGYAHFNYSEGVGAYNNDGSLKDGAIVIYVTEENKNTVMSEVVANYSFLNMFQVPNYGGGKDWKNKDATGIGWWLNNAQYGMDNANSSKNKRPSNTYVANASEREKLGFNTANLEHPIVVRFIGTVTVPEGCSAYNSEDEGGSVGDNGNMVRMKNLKNITIEGIGDDATIKGWGFHFMAGAAQTNGQGKNFEVRNLTFTEYTEDAIGMEGVQSGSTITGPVERCWVHNNVFLPGRCDSPAESDKKEGDGSCDFKRGQYFTLSYNYFEYCHKTNLIGSSDSSLQYNITMHHNMWYQCGSRIPLLRQANLHFYNNYILSDATESTTPYSHIAKPSLSYVTSLRANCLMFSEANYYDGCKNITQNKGALGVAWNNVYTSQSGEQSLTELTSRTQYVEAACSYQGTKFSGFYANESLFYYDKTNEKSDCLLDDAVGARTRVLQQVGTIGFGKTDLAMNQYEPSKAVQAGTTVDATAVKASGETDGVLFKSFNGEFKAGKGKGQIATFRLTSSMLVTIKGATGKGEENYPQLLDSYGKVWIERFSGDRSVVLPAGTYFIATGLKDKESNLGSISFVDTGASKQERIDAAKEALAAIPSTITINGEHLIKAAHSAYSALLDDEKTDADIVTLYPRYAKASEAFAELQIAYVIARIAYIGEVTANSYNRIHAAQTAYSNLHANQQSAITNYNLLTAAWATYEGFAAQNVINKLLDLPDLSSPTVKVYKREALDKLQDWFNAIYDAFNALTSGEDEGASNQQATVIAHNNGATYKKLTDGLAELTQIEKLFDFNDALDAANVDDANTVGATLLSLYNGLTAEQQATITGEAKTKYESIIEAYSAIANQKKVLVFNNKAGITEDTDFWTFNGTYKDGSSATINGTTYTGGLKFDKNGKITFTVTSKMTLKVYFTLKTKIALNGVTDKIVGEADGDHNVGTIEIEAGTHTLSKGKDGESAIFMVELIPA